MSEPLYTPSRAIEPNAIYTAQEAAHLLSLHPKTLKQKLHAFKIKGSLKLGQWRVMGSELLKFA